MARPIVTLADEAPADAGRGLCTWCRQPVGLPHADDCVTVKRRVVVRAIVEYEISVPEHWGPEEIEFHRNDGSWCANNMLYELEKVDDCLCPLTRYEFVREMS